MKIEKITENKIRIILNLEDLEAKNIDLHSLMANSIESQSLFVDMLDEAEKTVGFYTKDAKIMIEAVASSDGIFIFTITKVEEETPNKRVCIKRKTTRMDNANIIYQFLNFDEYCSFCSCLKSEFPYGLNNLAKNSSLYFFNNTYYLVVSDINLGFENLKQFYATVTEFAMFVPNPEAFASKLYEYGKSIMQRNAIERSIKHFG